VELDWYTLFLEVIDISMETINSKKWQSVNCTNQVGYEKELKDDQCPELNVWCMASKTCKNKNVSYV